MWGKAFNRIKSFFKNFWNWISQASINDINDISVPLADNTAVEEVSPITEKVPTFTSSCISYQFINQKILDNKTDDPVKIAQNDSLLDWAKLSLKETTQFLLNNDKINNLNDTSYANNAYKLCLFTLLFFSRKPTVLRRYLKSNADATISAGATYLSSPNDSDIKSAAFAFFYGCFFTRLFYFCPTRLASALSSASSTTLLDTENQDKTTSNSTTLVNAAGSAAAAKSFFPKLLNAGFQFLFGNAAKKTQASQENPSQYRAA